MRWYIYSLLYFLFHWLFSINQSVREAIASETDAQRQIKQFANSLISMDIKALAESVKKIHKAAGKASKIYEKTIANFPKSSMAYRKYANFCRTILCNFEFAFTLDEMADNIIEGSVYYFIIL